MCRHQCSLELIRAQFCPFRSMSWSMFSHNPHVHHLTGKELARAWDSCSCGKVHALTLEASKITSQHFFFSVNTINWTQTWASTSEHSDRAPNVYRHFFVFIGPFVGRCRGKEEPNYRTSSKNIQYITVWSIKSEAKRIYWSGFWLEEGHRVPCVGSTLSCPLWTGANFISVKEIALRADLLCSEGELGLLHLGKAYATCFYSRLGTEEPVKCRDSHQSY